MSFVARDLSLLTDAMNSFDSAICVRDHPDSAFDFVDARAPRVATLSSDQQAIVDAGPTSACDRGDLVRSEEHMQRLRQRVQELEAIAQSQTLMMNEKEGQIRKVHSAAVWILLQ
ncbi:hypothetical protein BV25DRAFT_1920109 [Artomyces pyxidatus]|uniref:Uncharacterized protein n=1 Tax=Artomyces pyxidatus TaxID=48021 RepID=A0ACB8SMC2_9AGAM|nr:hypothetical protein BV25DRAFT_1920109 [Artomyces pyxidatus]